MKKILLLAVVFSAILFGSNVQKKDDAREVRIKKQIEKEMATEKKYAKEQTFYQGKYYDLKGSEVNEESVKELDEVKVDDLDMDSVYD